MVNGPYPTSPLIRNVYQAQPEDSTLIQSLDYHRRTAWRSPSLERGSDWASISKPDNLNYLATPGTETKPSFRSSAATGQELIDAELARHTQHLSPLPEQALPPVAPSRQLASSPLPQTEFRLLTPPSSAAPRRRVLKAPFGRAQMDKPNPSPKNDRHLMPPPDTPIHIANPSPLFFPSLQFSPDLFQLQAAGPATAPVFPQQKLFWDPSAAGLDQNPTPTQYQDPFTGIQQGIVNGTFPSPELVTHFQTEYNGGDQQPYDLPHVSGTGLPDTSIDPFSSDTPLPMPFKTSPRVPTQRVEDPGLFLSSPARRFGGADTTALGRATSERPAYHHQIEESKREREEKARKARERRVPSANPSLKPLARPSSPIANTRPGLKRSLTHTGVGDQVQSRNQSHVSFTETGSNMGRVLRSGRSSPLKSSRETPRASASALARKRTSMTLTIDSDGRAKTVVNEARDTHMMDLDEVSSSPSEDDSDDPDRHYLRSQPNSFNFSLEHPAGHPSMGFGSHSKYNSYSNLTSRHPKQDRLQSLTISQNRQRFRGGSQDHPVPKGDGGDAQQALRAIIEGRPLSRSTLDGSVSGHGSVAASQFHSSPPVHQGFGIYNASPTTITDPDVATPSTDRESLSSNNSTRCVCSSTSPEGQFMIQW